MPSAMPIVSRTTSAGGEPRRSGRRMKSIHSESNLGISRPSQTTLPTEDNSVYTIQILAVSSARRRTIPGGGNLGGSFQEDDRRINLYVRTHLFWRGNDHRV